jgi:hypothetical protein
VTVRKCIEALGDGGYDGFLTLEFEGLEDAMKGVEIGMENLIKYTEK